MKFYLKLFEDGGHEYSPVGVKLDQEKLDQGFAIVDEIPQRIRDKEPGGKDWVEPEPSEKIQLRELAARVQVLESAISKGL